MIRNLFIFLVTVIILQACLKTETVSPVPEVRFKSFELTPGFDTLNNPILIGALKFSFTDGDADFGLYGIDTSADDWDERNYNIFLSTYEKVDDSYFLILPDSGNPPPWYSVFHDNKLDRVGQNRTINADVTIDIEYRIIPDYDTIRYDFYIRDRAGNKSNVESTSDIGFKGVEIPQ